MPIPVGSGQLVSVLETETSELEAAPLKRQLIEAINSDRRSIGLRINRHAISVQPQSPAQWPPNEMAPGNGREPLDSRAFPLRGVALLAPL